MPGITRSFTSFSQAAQENGRSRIYMGVHWRFDDIDGEQLGRQIADYTISHALEPVRKFGPVDHYTAVATFACGKVQFGHDNLTLDDLA